MRKKVTILLILVVTVGCIYLGFRTREKNGIVVTQIQTSQPNSLNYLLETSENKLIMLDGGSNEDSEALEQKLLAKGGIVESWFITMASPENFGAMKSILENGKVQINRIYVSFNEASWYGENEPEKYPEIAEFLDLIYSEKNITKVFNVPLRHEILIDNLYFTILNVANPSIKGTFNQTMAIKVNNTYKSMIFMGNIAKEAAEKLKDNNLDEIACDAVQVSNQPIQPEIYEKMAPTYVFVPNAKTIDEENLKIKETYTGEVTVKIW